MQSCTVQPDLIVPNGGKMRVCICHVHVHVEKNDKPHFHEFQLLLGAGQQFASNHAKQSRLCEGAGGVGEGAGGVGKGVGVHVGFGVGGEVGVHVISFNDMAVVPVMAVLQGCTISCLEGRAEQGQGHAFLSKPNTDFALVSAFRAKPSPSSAACLGNVSIRRSKILSWGSSFPEQRRTTLGLHGRGPD